MITAKTSSGLQKTWSRKKSPSEDGGGGGNVTNWSAKVLKFRICAFLIWMCIRFRGSATLDYESGCGSRCGSFPSVTFKVTQKSRFSGNFFCLVLTEGSFLTFFKDNKLPTSHRTIIVLLIILLWRRKDPDPN